MWFHLVCVGLRKSEVKDLDNWTCSKCRVDPEASEEQPDVLPPAEPLNTE